MNKATVMVDSKEYHPFYYNNHHNSWIAYGLYGTKQKRGLQEWIRL